MNIVEMHTLCDLLLDKANSPWFTTEEKDSFINLAQAEFAESRYSEFELNERVRKELLPLVRRHTDSGATIDLDGITDYMFTLSLMGDFPNLCGVGTTTRKISPLQLDDEAENLHDPFNKPADDNALYTEEHNGTNNVVLILSDNAPSSTILKYLKKPIDVKNDEATPSNSVDCELPPFTHEEIVNIAVRKMMATTEQQLNYQLHSNEINNQN